MCGRKWWPICAPKCSVGFLFRRYAIQFTASAVMYFTPSFPTGVATDCFQLNGFAMVFIIACTKPRLIMLINFCMDMFLSVCRWNSLIGTRYRQYCACFVFFLFVFPSWLVCCGIAFIDCVQFVFPITSKVLEDDMSLYEMNCCVYHQCRIYSPFSLLLVLVS